MATSDSPRNPAQLIREMSKDMNRTRTSSGSSRNSLGAVSPEPTTSDFDPENEAIMSTRRLDSHSKHLSELRASAQKFSRFAQPAEPDYAINTSAIGRAFPDFSQGGISSEDDSVSIEIGRGLAKGSSGTIGKLGRSKEYSSNAQLSLDDGDSMDFSAPMVGNYEVTTTPPLKRRQASKRTDDGTRGPPRHETQARKPSSLKREIFDPSPPPAKIMDYGSGESRKGSEGSRRTLSSMHARVREENDQSRISDERPPTVDLTARNTRFGNTKNLKPVSTDALPTRFSSAQTLLDSVAPNNKPKRQALATPNQGTQQSFMLPDLPNISELVSGVFEDGTPVFSRHGKSRASRFVSVSQQNRSSAREYAGVHEIPVPSDEQAIFLSLKLLQDKVAILEKTNAEAVSTIEELQQKNGVLEGERKERRRAPRSNSALGTADTEGSHNRARSQRQLLIEKNRLEASARALQHQVDAGRRKYSTAETILKQITQERDSAVSQLGVAFVTIEQLKVENEGLKAENIELRGRIDQLSNGYNENAQSSRAKEKTLQQKLVPNAESFKTTMEENIPPMHETQSAKTLSGHVKGHAHTNKQDRAISSQKDVDTMFDLSARQDTSSVRGQGLNQNAEEEDSQESENSVYEAPHKSKSLAQPYRRSEDFQNHEMAQDLTYLSFLDSQEIAQLRKTLEQERIERKQRRSIGRQLSKSDPPVTQTGIAQQAVQSSSKAAPRKSSMKELTAKSSQQRDTTETSHHAEDQPEHTRRHSEPSILSTRSRRRGLGAENMTSAFIVPDITIRNAGVNHTQTLKLTKEGQDVLRGLAAHEGQNCTVCKRTTAAGDHHEHDEVAKNTVKIPKPIPVSERVLQASEDEEPTIRPAQVPGLALATVLKELEDELAHLKIQLAQYQKLFNSHDPALSKRRRKSVQVKIEDVLHAIDVKADQIYALYDVLEGQKQDGHEISDEEVEITLQSIGVKAPELHLRGGGDEEVGREDATSTERHPWDLESNEDSGEELPWEGIESTVETTRSGFARAARRRNVGT